MNDWRLVVIRAPIVALLLGLLVVLGGCGGGAQTAQVVATTPAAAVDFQWGAARVSDPPALVSARDADGAVVTAGAGQVLITVADDVTEAQLDALLARIVSLGGDVVGAIEDVNFIQAQFSVDADLGVLEAALAEVPGVESVSLNELATPLDSPYAARSADAQPLPSPTAFTGDYWIAQIGLRAAWARLPADAAWPALGIVDEGPGNVRQMISPLRLELVDSQGTMLGTVATTDDHLSRVVAHAAADGATSTWGVGFGSPVYAVDIGLPAMPETVYPVMERTYYSRVVVAMSRLLKKGCRVINISLGPANASTQMADADYYAAVRRFRANLVGSVGQAARQGTLVCIASGNEAKKHDDRLLPGNEPAAAFLTHVLLVAASGPGDPRGPAVGHPAVQDYANEGALVPITAPGEAISPGPSVSPDGGTSYASPIVAGAALAVMAANPRLNAAQVRAILIETGSRNVTSGSGLRLLDVDAAVARALATPP